MRCGQVGGGGSLTVLPPSAPSSSFLLLPIQLRDLESIVSAKMGPKMGCILVHIELKIEFRSINFVYNFFCKKTSKVRNYIKVGAYQLTYLNPSAYEIVLRVLHV